MLFYKKFFNMSGNFWRNNMSIKIKKGISIISAMTYGKSADRCIANALRVGYHGIQSLPLKIISGNEDHVICFEDVWNPRFEHFWQINPMKSKDGIFVDMLQLFVLFKKGKQRQNVLANYEKNGITQIAHQFNWRKNVLFELCPEFGTLEWIEDRVRGRELLVADTRHLIDQEKMFGIPAESIIERFSKNLAPVVHFQPYISTAEFLERTKNLGSVNEDSDWASLREIQILKCILNVIGRNFEDGLYPNQELTTIVEYNPKWSFLREQESISLMSKMLERHDLLIERFF